MSALHVTSDLTINELPRECIEDCTAPGPVDVPCEHWRETLGFTVDRDRAIAHLENMGAWERSELETWDDAQLARYILWDACATFKEWDGTESSPCGSDYFYMGT